MAYSAAGKWQRGEIHIFKGTKIILKAELPTVTMEARRQWNYSAEANELLF